MLRGVDPATHGLADNSPDPVPAGAPSVLAVVRAAGRVTASVNNWAQIDTLIEPGASVYRMFVDGGYDPDEDELMVDMLAALLRRTRPEVAFVYLCAPDLAGHSFGWGSAEYLESLRLVDATFGRLLTALGPDADVVVTTDHGGDGRNHGTLVDDVMDVFVAVRSTRVAPGSMWVAASTLDIAPTVTDLAGVDPDPGWQGTSLIGRQVQMVDHLLAMLAECEAHRYGEDLTMLAHALQAAAEMQSGGNDDELVVAALLHDIGHLLGHAGAYGFVEHAMAGARYLQPWFPSTITEPIRLHVAAKRHLVGATPDYAGRLSEASRITLEQQGGAFGAAQQADFLAEPHAERALRLRRCDDQGKRSDIAPLALGEHRGRLVAALANGPIDATWARDACRCHTCRDAVSGQHLLDVGDLTGWTVLGSRRRPGALEVDLARGPERHTAVVEIGPAAPQSSVVLWSAATMPRPSRRASDIALIADDVTRYGLARVTDVATEHGQVLRFAATLGFVRETNYGQLFDVRTEAGATNLASTALGLPLHTDNPYRDPAPTVQILHCLRPAASGGLTRLADGYAAAHRLRIDDPATFAVLSTTPVTFRFRDDDVDLVARRSVIEVAPDGDVRAVALNHRSLDTPAGAAYAAALAAFVELLEASAIELSLAAGDAIVFDNRRIVHARTGFDPSSGRHLQGCYIDIDALHSAARRAR
jgi:predicted HD phosphohydrolase/alpha-ketoglutarate-dependent taurine dioxygenase